MAARDFGVEFCGLGASGGFEHRYKGVQVGIESRDPGQHEIDEI